MPHPVHVTLAKSPSFAKETRDFLPKKHGPRLEAGAAAAIPFQTPGKLPSLPTPNFTAHVLNWLSTATCGIPKIPTVWRLRKDVSSNPANATEQDPVSKQNTSYLTQSLPSSVCFFFFLFCFVFL